MSWNTVSVFLKVTFSPKSTGKADGESPEDVMSTMLLSYPAISVPITVTSTVAEVKNP